MTITLTFQPDTQSFAGRFPGEPELEENLLRRNGTDALHTSNQQC